MRILDSLPVQVAPKNKKTELDGHFTQLLSHIEVIGFDLQSIPAITNLTYFMNQQFYLQSNGKKAEAQKLDFPIG